VGQRGRSGRDDGTTWSRNDLFAVIHARAGASRADEVERRRRRRFPFPSVMTCLEPIRLLTEIVPVDRRRKRARRFRLRGSTMRRRQVPEDRAKCSTTSSRRTDRWAMGVSGEEW